MKQGIKEIFGACVIFAPVVALGVFLACPVGSEPKLDVEPGHTVTLTAQSGDKMTCLAPLAKGAIACVLPDGEKVVCHEIDNKTIFSNCSQPWKWAWQDKLSRQQTFGADPEAVKKYEKSHPIVARSAL